MNSKIVVVCGYPLTRPTDIISNQTKAWKILREKHDEIREILPDPSMDEKYRILKKLTSYGMFHTRLKKAPLHLECKMKGSGTYVFMTLKLFPIQ